MPRCFGLSGSLFCGFVFFLTTTLPAPARVVINEIHYHPDPKTEPAEFVELYNSGTAAVNLSGWSLAGGIAYNIPNGTSLGSGQCLVIAQDPPTILGKFGVSALGPWQGKLNNDGDKVVLHNAAGGTEDEVDFQLGFPWPTVGDPPGYSIELINPAFDTSLGGNWRASVVGNPNQQTFGVIADHSGGWKYFKGLSEASSPTTAWRFLDFDDSTWGTGAAPVGYDASLTMGTKLSDMRYNYTSFFLRRLFVVNDPTPISSLRIEVLYDDGFKLWINGTNVLNRALPSTEVPYDAVATGSARESNNYDVFNLDNPGVFLRPGTNILAVQVHNILLSGSSDCFFDCRLFAITGPPSHGPTPGRLNSVYATNAPPQIRQVDHSPKEPGSGQPVTITAKISDPEGVGNVTLQYQSVDPGNYIALTDDAYTNNWTSVPMNDDGINGDALADDSVFTGVLPGSLQQHRRLVRYRISTTDGAGLSITGPYSDDPQPNFAYFCYDGVPAWQAAVRPGYTPVLTFDTSVMRRLPTVHLLSKKTDVENATWFSRYAGDAYLWLGTLVYDGKVYDHIHYRARGGVWRYAMVKNMWKFDLNRGHDLEMRDDYGKRYHTTWTKLNLGACIQQGDYQHRGEQGMFESVGFRMFNLAGVEAPNTVFLQYRIIDDAVEASPTDQYEGDFWGLYLAVEQEDGRFLDEHGMPDGNFYKMEGGSGELNNLGPLGPTDKSDLNSFLSTYRSSTQPPSEDWWRSNLSLSNYFSYQAVVQGIHHYDICYDKNYFYYRNPETEVWSVHSWDLDLTWANNMFDSGCGGIDDLYYPVFGGNGYPAKTAINLEYKNRVREIRDLLFNTDQAWTLIDEYASLARGPTNGPTFLDADRCQWDYNPKMIDSTYSSALNKAGQGRFYQWSQEPTVSKDFNGCVQLMKNYIVYRSGLLDALANDPVVPTQPSVTYIGPAGCPINQLAFRCSPYQGAYGFAAMKWRVGEVTDTTAPSYDPTEAIHYETTPVWESGELSSFDTDLTLPASALKVGHAYRVRVRLEDNTGRCSHWSAPVQFIAGLPDTAAALLANLRITELMHNPPAGPDYEFIELHNTSDNLTLDLAGAKFTSGVDYTFDAGASMGPGAYLLLVQTTNLVSFRQHYGLSSSVPICGPYDGNLANEGEQLTLKVSAGGTEIASFKFDNGRGWPVAAQDAGHSMVPLDSALEGEATGALDYPGNWRASTYIGGSPGASDPPCPAPTVVLNEIAAHTDYSDPLRPEYDSDDWIELYNTTATNVSLDGWFLSDDPADPRKWPIPSVTIPARQWITFDEVHNFHNPITTGFGLDKAGEQVLLSFLPGTAGDRVVDAVQFKGQENERSLGRYPDGANWWYPMLRSSNTVNTAGLTSLVINEVMYHPPDGTDDNTTDEYVEVLNTTAVPIILQDTNGAWRLSGGIDLDFAPNTTLPAGGVLLAVNFDPADTAALARFRSIYGVTNPAVPILGPYGGKLSNRSDRIALEKPQYPDLAGDPYSWVILDEVIYGNQNPWPPDANGTGFALHRLSVTRSGDDPANWVAGLPSPGSADEGPIDRDGDGMPDSWEIAQGLDPDDPRDAALDADGDGMSNLAEFLSGTNPRDASSRLGFDRVTTDESGVILRFTALADRSYSIQFRPDASGLQWEKLTDVPAGPTRSVEITDPATSAFNERFYRLVTPSLP